MKKMGMCPICNGFTNVALPCPNCSGSLEDSGREADFYDDYSPYMPIDQMKLEDGYPADFTEEECPHLFKCSSCGASHVFLIKE
jgi:hypothetical protein